MIVNSLERKQTLIQKTEIRYFPTVLKTLTAHTAVRIAVLVQAFSYLPSIVFRFQIPHQLFILRALLLWRG